MGAITSRGISARTAGDILSDQKGVRDETI